MGQDQFVLKSPTIEVFHQMNFISKWSLGALQILGTSGTVENHWSLCKFPKEKFSLALTLKDLDESWPGLGISQLGTGLECFMPFSAMT